ncbi:Na+-dependent transporter [Actinobacillus equuli]|nr:Na+-dependent transporter [Actinobacillus equuli]
MNALLKITQFVSKTFAIWVVFFAFIAAQFPDTFKQFVPWIPYLLGIVMLGMGLTLTFKDFAEVTKIRSSDFRCNCPICRDAEYRFCLAKAFQLPPDLAIGVILVGSCPAALRQM